MPKISVDKLLCAYIFAMIKLLTMKKHYIFLYLCALSFMIPSWGAAQVAQTEKLNRGVVAVNMS